MSSWVDHHRFKVLALVLTLASGPPLAITYWDYFFPPEHGLTYEQFIDVQEALRTKLKAETADAVWQERQRYQSQLLEVEARLADPGIAYQNALAKIADLEELLESQSSISAARINEAKEALAKGDYSEADAIFAEVQRDGADAVQQVAAAAYGQGEIAEAEIRWHDAAAHYAKAARLDPNFDTLKKAREYAWRSGDYRKSLRYGEDLLELAQTDPSISDEQRATAMNEQALSLRDLGFYGKAEQLYRQAIEIHKATIGTAHPDYAKGLNNLAGLLRTTGRYDEAEPLYRQAIEIDKATIGTSHPDYAIHLNNLALLLETTGRYDEAEQLYRQAIEIDEATIGTSHPGDATDLNNLALLLETTGRYDEAEQLYRQAIEIDEATIGTAHPNYATRLNNLALLLENTGRYDEAEQLYRQAIEIDEAIIGTSHPDYAIDLNNLAYLLKTTGRYDEAEQLYRQAIEVFEDTLGAEHPNTQTGKANLQRMLDEKS